MLYPFAIVKIQVLLNLTFLFPFCRLVDGKFYKSISISHYLTDERRVSGRNIIVIKTEDIVKPHYILIKFYPEIHLVPTYINYTMVHIQKACWCRIIIWFPLPVPWQEKAFVIFSFYKQMHQFSIRMYATYYHFGVIIF